MSLLNKEDSIILPEILRGVSEMGFEQLTPIQEQAIPAMLEGRDLIGQAQTGTGKTAAFGIPMLQMMDPECSNVQGLVLCPTRELAIQAAEEMRKFAKYMHNVKVLPIYGGQDISKQIRSLKSGVAIVVGTPGRVMDHMRRHTLKLQDLKIMVLDEADEMLNMGFREDIETILEGIPTKHQTALFSATMPKAILEITKKYQEKDAKIIEVAHKELTIPLVKQYYCEVNSSNKKDVAARLLDYYNPKRGLIFCNTKYMVDQLSDELKGRGYFADGLHGDLSQAQRDKVMRGFRNGTTEILIATDVAARGIDVDDVEIVINYDVPQDIEYYVHRIGRTGRAGKKGRAFTLVVGREIFKIREIERACKTTMKVRAIPSAADVTEAKAEEIFRQVMKTREKEDLTAMIHLIEAQLEEQECTALEIAAVFLKMQMGEEPKEIKVEKYDFKKNRRRGRGQGQGRRDQGGRNQGRRESGNREDNPKRKRGPFGGERKNKNDKKNVKKYDKMFEKKFEKKYEKKNDKKRKSI